MQSSARSECYGHAVGVCRLIYDSFSIDLRDCFLGIQRIKQTRAQMPVFDHEPHWPFFDLGVIEVHEKR